MRLLFWIASKNLASRRLYSACAILGIAFGVATVVAVQVVDHNTVISLREHHRRFTGDPDRVLTLRDPRQTTPAAATEALSRLTAITAFTPMLADRVALLVNGKPALSAPFFSLNVGSAADFDAYAIERGRDFRPGERGAFLCGWQAAQDAKLKLGERYVLQRPSVTPYGCADGQLVPRSDGTRRSGPQVELELVGILQDRYLGHANGNRALVVPSEEGLALMGDLPHLTRYWIRIADGANPAALTERLEKDFRVEVPEAREVGETREERAFRSGVRLAAFMALGLGLFIIFHLLTLSVTSWVRQVGLLGALGITGGALAGVFLLEALILAVTGTACGLGIGVLIAKLMMDAGLSTLGWGRPVFTFALPWGDLWWIASAGIGACLVGAIHPIARVRSIPVLDALTQGEAALGRTVAPRWLAPAALAGTPAATLGLAWLLHPMEQDFLEVAFLIALCFGVFVIALWVLPQLLGRAFGVLIRPLERPDRAGTFLVRRGLRRGIRRFAGSVTGLSLVAAGIVALHAMTGALKQEKDDWAERALSGRIFLRMPQVPRARLAFLDRIPGVASAVPLDASFRQSLMEIRGVPPAAVFAQGMLADRPDDRAMFRAGRGVVVTSHLARERGLDVGDEVKLSTLKGPRRYRVLAIDDRFGFHPHERSYALLDETTVHRVFCRSNEFVNICAVGVTSPDLERRVAHAIRDEAGDLDISIMTGAGQRKAYRHEINRDFAVFDVILLLTGVLAGLGLLNSLLVASMERTKETGLLRAIGITRRQVFGMFLSESLMLGVAGGVLGSAMGIVFSMLAVNGLAHLSELPLTWRFDAVWVLIAIGVLTAFSALAAIIPAMQAERADVIKAIKYE